MRSARTKGSVGWLITSNSCRFKSCLRYYRQLQQILNLKYSRIYYVGSTPSKRETVLKNNYLVKCICDVIGSILVFQTGCVGSCPIKCLYGRLVKWLRHRTFYARTRVRLPYRLLISKVGWKYGFSDVPFNKPKKLRGVFSMSPG